MPSSNSYGTTTGIERLIGDIVISRAFTSTTIPNSTQVEAFIDDIGAELNRELSAAGFQIPVSTATNPIEHRWLQGINEKGAAALVLNSMPAVAFAPGFEDAGANRAEVYIGFFNRAIENIREHRFTAARTRGRLGATFAGSQSDSNNNRKLPIFKRGADKTPGTRKLTE